MTNTLPTNHSTLGFKHRENVIASLNRRLAVAKAMEDTHLIELLEQEQRQISGRSDRPIEFLRRQFSTLWDDCVALVRGDTTLQVWQTVDQQGERWWCAYNPQTGQSIYADSEAEMRIWIEQNYVSEIH